ncbi:MAG: hypothetical protein ACLUOF_00930 [Ruminococcus sp.]
MDFTAHIRESDGMEQSVTEHCRNVAALAESYGESVGLGKLARLQGIFHDAGKLNQDFYASSTETAAVIVVRSTTAMPGQSISAPFQTGTFRSRRCRTAPPV